MTSLIERAVSLSGLEPREVHGVRDVPDGICLICAQVAISAWALADEKMRADLMDFAPRLAGSDASAMVELERVLALCELALAAVRPVDGPLLSVRDVRRLVMSLPPAAEQGQPTIKTASQAVLRACEIAYDSPVAAADAAMLALTLFAENPENRGEAFAVCVQALETLLAIRDEVLA